MKKKTMITDQCDEVARLVMCEIVNKGGEIISDAIQKHAERNVNILKRDAHYMREEIRALREELFFTQMKLFETQSILNNMTSGSKGEYTEYTEGKDSASVCLASDDTRQNSFSHKKRRT